MTEYIAYVLSVPLGFLLTSKFLHLKKKYFWFEYAAIFLIPTVVLSVMYLTQGKKILVLFFIFCLAGTLAEAVVGYTYLNMTGKHLWVYEKYPIFNRTTSLLSIPFWGFVSVAMYSIQKVILMIGG
jgi:hypothetical protein